MEIIEKGNYHYHLSYMIWLLTIFLCILGLKEIKRILNGFCDNLRLWKKRLYFWVFLKMFYDWKIFQIFNMFFFSFFKYMILFYITHFQIFISYRYIYGWLWAFMPYSQDEFTKQAHLWLALGVHALFIEWISSLMLWRIPSMVVYTQGPWFTGTFPMVQSDWFWVCLRG